MFFEKYPFIAYVVSENIICRGGVCCMKKVFLGIGHGGSDCGAIGNGLREKDLNLKQGLFCEKHLKRHGVLVMLSRYKDEDDSTRDEVYESNLFNPDLAVDLHTNAGGGSGFEVFHSVVSSAIGDSFARNINDEIVCRGYKSRGIKTKVNVDGRDYFGFIRETNCPAVIAEMAFIDNKLDIRNFDEDHEIEAYCICLVRGILKTLGIEYRHETNEESNFEDGDDLYRVVCGVYKDRINALKQQEKIQSLGVTSFIKRG
jgi:N-acetylmuramoyl-L-alanine amidase